LLELIQVKKRYPLGGRRYFDAVRGVSLTINRGVALGLVGESGSGKSTLARLALRLIEPTAGKIIFDGSDITSKKRGELRPVRKSMQMVFQNPFSSFNPRIRIKSALMEICRYYRLEKAPAEQKIAALVGEIGLQVDILDRRPRELSGGQLQRLAIARALLCDPALLVADEPVSALDVSVQAQLLNLFADLRRRLDLTILFISHDMGVVEYLCDRIAVMKDGAIVETGSKEKIFSRPEHPYTKNLIASAPQI
jgi:ABC-type oligopeptide transport system ATPase subunit